MSHAYDSVDQVIDYTKEDVVASALKHGPYTLILDCVGGTTLIPHLSTLLETDLHHANLGDIYITIVGDKTHRNTMGGPITNMTNPLQAIRTWRGQASQYNPLKGKKYLCMMLEADFEQFETIEGFVERGGEVVIDQVFGFMVSSAVRAISIRLA